MISSAPASFAMAAFVVGAGGAVNSRAEHLRHLHDQASRAARRRMHQALSPFFNGNVECVR